MATDSPVSEAGQPPTDVSRPALKNHTSPLVMIRTGKILRPSLFGVFQYCGVVFTLSVFAADA